MDLNIFLCTAVYTYKPYTDIYIHANVYIYINIKIKIP